jgi:hypothetical protein
MASLRSIEILGGPLDGRRIIWDAEIDCMMWTDGSRIYQHAIDEIWTGKKNKTVLRHVATVPLPKKPQ